MIYAAEKILNAYQHKAGASLTPLEVADLVRKLGLVRDRTIVDRPRISRETIYNSGE